MAWNNNNFLICSLIPGSTPVYMLPENKYIMKKNENDIKKNDVIKPMIEEENNSTAEVKIGLIKTAKIVSEPVLNAPKVKDETLNKTMMQNQPQSRKYVRKTRNSDKNKKDKLKSWLHPRTHDRPTVAGLKSGKFKGV